MVLSGCAKPTVEIMNSWNGSHVSALIRSWGPPNRVTSDGAGGKIYIWSVDISLPLTSGKARTKGTASYNPYLDEYTVKSKTTYTEPLFIEGKKVRMFWVNERGIIYHWKAQGFVQETPEQEAAFWLGLLAIAIAYTFMMAAIDQI